MACLGYQGRPFLLTSPGSRYKNVFGVLCGSQRSHDSTYPCAVVFTSPLTSKLCSQLQELQELPTSPEGCGIAQKSISFYLPGSWSWTRDTMPTKSPPILWVKCDSQSCTWDMYSFSDSHLQCWCHGRYRWSSFPSPCHIFGHLHFSGGWPPH